MKSGLQKGPLCEGGTWAVVGRGRGHTGGGADGGHAEGALVAVLDEPLVGSRALLGNARCRRPGAPRKSWGRSTHSRLSTWEVMKVDRGGGESEWLLDHKNDMWRGKDISIRHTPVGFQDTPPPRGESREGGVCLDIGCPDLPPPPLPPPPRKGRGRRRSCGRHGRSGARGRWWPGRRG